MFVKCLQYPSQGEGTLKLLLTGGLLLILSPLLIPLLIVYGYLNRVARSVAVEEPTPPTFSGVGQLVATGILGIMVVLSYYLLGVALTALSAGLWYLGIFPDFLLLAILLFVPFTTIYLAPAALVNYAITGKFSKAFDITQIRDGAATKQYAVGWIAGMFLSSVGFGVTFALSAILIGIPLSFYVLMSATALFARGYSLGRWEDNPSETPHTHILNPI